MTPAGAPAAPGGRARSVRALPQPQEPADDSALPPEVALAAYRVLQAFQLISDLAATDLPEQLARAIGLGASFDRGSIPPCRDCGVEVHLGLPHADACLSDEAIRRRKVPVPKLIQR
jgi:hypothetical protein